MKKLFFIIYLFLSNAVISQAFFISQLGADIDGEAAGDLSGYSVSMNAVGDRVAIGAISNTHVRIYEWNGTAWIQLGADIDGEAASDKSGWSVSMNAAGNKVAIGAKDNDGNGINSGHVRIYEWNGTAWTQLGADIDGEAAGDNSGYFVAMNFAGDRVAIGAKDNDGNGADAGHVRIYNWNGTAWIQLGADIDGEAAGDNSGYSVAMNLAGDRLAIGAKYNNGNAGHVRIDSGCFGAYVTDSQVICGSSYTWINGNTYNQNTNLPTVTLNNSAGCDSIVTLNLIINPDDFNLAISATQQVFTAPPFAAVFSNNTPNMSDYTFTWDFGDDSTLQTNNSNVFHEYIYNGLYEVKLMAENNNTGCRDTLAEQDFIFTSGGPNLSIIESKKIINLYPNPTNENITILVSNYNGNFQTEVYDLIGNKLQTSNETTFSLSNYSKGIYILKVAYGDKVKELKVIKD